MRTLTEIRRGAEEPHQPQRGAGRNAAAAIDNFISWENGTRMTRINESESSDAEERQLNFPRLQVQL